MEGTAGAWVTEAVRGSGLSICLVGGEKEDGYISNDIMLSLATGWRQNRRKHSVERPKYGGYYGVGLSVCLDTP